MAMSDRQTTCFLEPGRGPLGSREPWPGRWRTRERALTGTALAGAGATPGAWVRFSGLLFVLLLAGGPGAALAQLKEPALFSLTNLVITCTNGSDFSTSAWISRGDVRVLDAQMYMECEYLSVLLLTNHPSAPKPSGAPLARSGSLTNVDARIDRIIAETNVLLMTRDVILIGDRAVYTQSNEVVEVTGALVIVETDRSYTFGTHFIFDLSTSQGSILGPHVMELKVGTTLGGTNGPRPGLGLPRGVRSGGSPREGTRAP